MVLLTPFSQGTHLRSVGVSSLIKNWYPAATHVVGLRDPAGSKDFHEIGLSFALASLLPQERQGALLMEGYCHEPGLTLVFFSFLFLAWLSSTQLSHSQSALATDWYGTCFSFTLICSSISLCVFLGVFARLLCSQPFCQISD